MRRCLKHLPSNSLLTLFAGKLPDCHPLFEIFVCHGFNKSYYIPAQLLNMIRDAVNIRCKNTEEYMRIKKGDNLSGRTLYKFLQVKNLKVKKDCFRSLQS